MIKTGMRTLAGTDNPLQAWKKFYDPYAVIGIKTNCLAGKHMSTRPNIINAIVSGLDNAGVKKKNIIVWERTT